MRSLGFDSESALSVNIGTERFPRRREERSGPGGPRAPVQRAAPPRAVGWGWGPQRELGVLPGWAGGPCRKHRSPPEAVSSSRKDVAKGHFCPWVTCHTRARARPRRGPWPRCHPGERRSVSRTLCAGRNERNRLIRKRA